MGLIMSKYYKNKINMGQFKDMGVEAVLNESDVTALFCGREHKAYIVSADYYEPLMDLVEKMADKPDTPKENIRTTDVREYCR